MGVKAVERGCPDPSEILMQQKPRGCLPLHRPKNLQGEEVTGKGKEAIVIIPEHGAVGQRGQHRPGVLSGILHHQRSLASTHVCRSST